MRFFQMLLHAWQDLLKAPSSTLANVLVIGVALSIPTVGYGLAKSVNELSFALEHKPHINIYISPEISPADIQVIEGELNFTNGIKNKDPGRDPVIELRALKSNDGTVLSISDNGIGIDMDKYGDKLFGMYKTFHNNPDARGIGLYITKNQIEAMQGKISVTSEVGKGSTFNIYFNENT